MHADLTDQDVAYVRSTFRAQSDAERERADRGLAPKPSYWLPDGTPMVSMSPDRDLSDATDPSDLHARFVSRWAAAGGSRNDTDSELAAWLGGGYGACLASPGPETILVKDGLARAITALVAQPMPEASWWPATLVHAVAAYDALVLPFASVDPARFGGTTSRQRLVDAVRGRWSGLFSPDQA